ncbi:MAG: hypothetical protein HN964_01730 [Candidatus Jacksonbacteria bacterium]|jgi:HTH-type transcriptional regulator, sugar sensing transcriptional regulator|nr:hypothetical protein [Candidatus Jacksonbacteria bacterium]MBT7008163.1 hypothetical protein [Candidatus Jacksonbacteria bacterium]
MQNKQEIEALTQIGLSEKAALVYIAALELGEATTQQLALKSNLKRTTVYYTVEELCSFGALIQVERNKKKYFVPEDPQEVLKLAQSRVVEFQGVLGGLQEKKHAAVMTPKVYFLYGVNGFKQMWDLIFNSGIKEYRIFTQGESFLGYVKEKYILDEIIAQKMKKGIQSKQIITDSAYARKIVAKDSKENRKSKILPPHYPLPFTGIVTSEFVAFFSPKYENMLFIVESDSFAKTMRSVFDSLWDNIETKK